MSVKLGNTTIAGISRETKLNAHSLLDFKWTDHILNEMSWLRADTFSWQSGDVYTSVYNELEQQSIEWWSKHTTKEIENGVYYIQTSKGYKICDADQEGNIMKAFRTTGTAWYYILDRENKRFKLPRTTHREIIESGDNYRVYSDGYCEQWGYLIPTTNLNIIKLIKSFKDTNYNITSSAGYTSDTNLSAPAVATEKNKDSFSFWINSTAYRCHWRACGYLADDQYSKSSLQNYKNLYFYVGQFSQTAIEETAGLNSTMFNNKVDKDDLTEVMLPIESFVSGASGYNIWSNGYCEQWGNFGPAFSSWSAKTITFMKEFKNTDYNVWAMTGHTSNTDSPCINVKTTTSFSCTPYNSTGNACWKACGYLADGEY